MITLKVKDREGESHEVEANEGDTLMETLREFDWGVAAICGGMCSCGTCHVPGDNFGISQERIAALPDADPFFFLGLDENPELLKLGLVHVVVPGAIDDFRRTPKLVHLRSLCDDDGNCDSLGLLGDRVRNLCAFSIQAIANHMSKTVKRVPGRDFRVPTEETTALWEAIDCPTLLLNATEGFPHRTGQEGTDVHFKHGQLVNVADAGHWVHHDQLDEVVLATKKFLTQT